MIKMEKYYVKVNKSNVVIDCISFPFKNYIEIEVEELPQGILSGKFKLVNGQLVDNEEYVPEVPKDEIKRIDEILSEHEAALIEAYELIAMLLEGGNE